jgi:hypothetical protein
MVTSYQDLELFNGQDDSSRFLRNVLIQMRKLEQKFLLTLEKGFSTFFLERVKA